MLDKKRKKQKCIRRRNKIFHQAMYLGYYAPEVIDGETTFNNNKKIIEIVDENKNIYRLEKNVSKSEFLDVNMLKMELSQKLLQSQSLRRDTVFFKNT